MADEPGTHRGWLPPNAPGAQPPPRFDAVPSPPPAPAPPGPDWSPPAADRRAQAGAPPAPGRPTFTRGQAPGPRNTTAAWALGLGIAGLALLLVSFGTLFLITLPCSIAALMLGRKAQGMAERGEIAAGQGQGQVTAALWLGRIGVIAGVTALVVFIALVASGFDFEQFRDDLQRELDKQREQDQGGGSGVRSAIEGLRAVIGR